MKDMMEFFRERYIRHPLWLLSATACSYAHNWNKWTFCDLNTAFVWLDHHIVKWIPENSPRAPEQTVPWMNVIFLMIFIFLVAMFGLTFSNHLSLWFLLLFLYLLHVHIQGCYRGAVCQGTDEAVQVHASWQWGRVSVARWVVGSIIFVLVLVAFSVVYLSVHAMHI